MGSWHLSSDTRVYAFVEMLLVMVLMFVFIAVGGWLWGYVLDEHNGPLARLRG